MKFLRMVVILMVAIIFTAIVSTPIVTFFMGMRGEILFILIPRAILIGLIGGIPAALPFCIVIHWRRWRSMKIWLLAGLVSGFLPAIFFDEGNILPLEDFLQFYLIFAAYSVPASLLYGYLHKSGWMRRNVPSS